MTRMSDYAYEHMRRTVYDGGATFVPVCPNCGRFIKADPEIFVNEIRGMKDAPNATCKKCGRVKMPFEGFI